MNRLIKYIITLLTAAAIASCSQDPLSPQSEAIRDDVSGKPIYDGLENDGLGFSLIPLVEGNWWEYSVTVEKLEIGTDGQLSPIPPTSDTYTLYCKEDYEQEGYRWFRMGVSKPLSLPMPTHVFTNDIESLSNRVEGLYKKSSGLRTDANGNLTVESGLWVPYLPNITGIIPLKNYEHTSIIIEKGLSHPERGGELFTDLIRYRYRTDLAKFFGLGQTPNAYAYYDYYFKEGVGLVSFSYHSDVNIVSEHYHEFGSDLSLEIIIKADIYLINHDLIEL